MMIGVTMLWTYYNAALGSEMTSSLSVSESSAAFIAIILVSVSLAMKGFKSSTPHLSANP